MKNFREVLKPFKGDYVSIEIEYRHIQNRDEETGEYRYSETKTRNYEGILGIGRNNMPIIDGWNLGLSHQVIDEVKVRRVFEVPKHAIKIMCKECWNGHPIEKISKLMRFGNLSTHLGRRKSDITCHVCMKGSLETSYFVKIPPFFWRFAIGTDVEEIGSELRGMEFTQILSDNSCTMYLYSCKFDIVNSRSDSKQDYWEYIWYCWETGERFYALSHNPPPTTKWFREHLKFKDFEDEMIYIRTGNGHYIKEDERFCKPR